MKKQEKILSEIQTIWFEDGHLSLGQSSYLIDLLSNLNPKFCLEIGFAGGRHASTLLHSCRPIKVFSIDIDFNYANGREYVDKFKKKFNTIEFYESNSNSILTEEFMKNNFPNGLDYVFVDGGHSYEECLADMKNCFKFLNENGIMLIDDYNSGPPIGIEIEGVDKAVDNFINENDVYFEKIKLSDGKGMMKIKRK